MSHQELQNTASRPAYRFGMKTDRPQVLAILAGNVRALMERRGWTQNDLARHSGVSQRHISNVLNRKHGPSVEIVDALAGAFGLPGWLLVIPGLPAELLDSHSIPSLVRSYLGAGPEGRQLIDRLAERESHHNAAAQKLLQFPKIQSR